MAFFTLGSLSSFVNWMIDLCNYPNTAFNNVCQNGQRIISIILIFEFSLMSSILKWFHSYWSDIFKMLLYRYIWKLVLKVNQYIFRISCNIYILTHIHNISFCSSACRDSRHHHARGPCLRVSHHLRHDCRKGQDRRQYSQERKSRRHPKEKSKEIARFVGRMYVTNCNYLLYYCWLIC